MVIYYSNVLKVISLYRADYRAGFHVRKAARLIGRTHPALLPVLGRMEDSGLLRYVVEGRNKVYYLNTSNIAAKELLALAERAATLDLIQSAPIFKRLLEEIIDLGITASIVVFGSQVKGYANAESDIDLLVVGSITKEQKSVLTSLGRKYARDISIKTVIAEELAEGLRVKNPLLIEVAADHIVLTNPDVFLNALWKVRP